MPAEVCEACNGTGIAPGFQFFDVERLIDDNGERLDPPRRERIRAKPGDRCLRCNGHGAIGLLGTHYADKLANDT